MTITGLAGFPVGSALVVAAAGFWAVAAGAGALAPVTAAIGLPASTTLADVRWGPRLGVTVVEAPILRA